MNIKIRKLTPDLVDDYVQFFDITPHSDNIDDHKCYCVCWCNDDYEGKDFSSAEKRRDYAIKYVKNNNIQGYLAYYENKVVGWCNANTKLDCLKCCSWRMFMGSMPIDELYSGKKTKSIFCFAIAPEMKRKGIAKMFLECVCQDAANEGFDIVEAYPNKIFINEEDDFMGPAELYRQKGFTVYNEIGNKLVMRRQL
jgi:GNAT superfamily N-acetyltransferase